MDTPKLHIFNIFNNFLRKKESYFKSDFWGLKHYYTSIFSRKRSAQLAFLNDQTQINLTHFNCLPYTFKPIILLDSSYVLFHPLYRILHIFSITLGDQINSWLGCTKVIRTNNFGVYILFIKIGVSLFLHKMSSPLKSLVLTLILSNGHNGKGKAFDFIHWI